MNHAKAKELTKRLKVLAKEDTSLNVNEFRIIVALERAIARLQQIKDLSNHLIFIGDVQVEALEEQGRYGALRFDCAYQIGEPKMHKIHKLSRVHVDVGFSDQLLAEAIEQSMPPLLNKLLPRSCRLCLSEELEIRERKIFMI